MSIITEESVKRNLILAREQQIANGKDRITSVSNFQELPEDPLQSLFISKEIQQQHLFIAFSQGLYPYQEDRAQCVEIQELPSMTHQELAENLYQTIITLGENYQKERSGSTLSAFIISKNYLIAANVGDSRIMLINKNKNEYDCQRITWDHKPYHETEIKRIEDEGGQVTFTDTYRLNGILAVSRTLGDSIVGAGLTYQPDITWIKTKDLKNAYVIAATDGITDTVHENDIALLFNQELPLEKIPTAIRQLAFTKGSIDNMTLILSPIMQPKKNNIILGFVADGHGGDDVSEFLRNELDKTFVEIIKKNHKNAHPKITSIFQS